MFPDPARLADPLARAGIRCGRSFSANVSNFQWTSTMVDWSQRPEAALGGDSGAVIDTSRNGDGPCNGGQAAGQFWTHYAMRLGQSRRT